MDGFAEERRHDLRLYGIRFTPVDPAETGVVSWFLSFTPYWRPLGRFAKTTKSAT